MQQAQIQYPQIDIKDLKLFAVWKWKSEELNQNCAICKKQMIDQCINCDGDNEQNETNKCIIVQGSCGHAFHKHCIRNCIQAASKGGNSSAKCPLCSLIWEIQNEQEVQN